MRNKRSRKKTHTKNHNILQTLFVILVTLIIFFIAIIINHLFIKDNNQINIGNSNYTDNNQTINSIENNISNQKPEKELPAEDITFNMAVTGDIMCHNTVYMDAYNSSKKTYDFSHMFEDIKYHLQTADLTIGNLETTFAGSKVGYSGYPTFNTPEILAKNLKKAGFDVVSTANNHSLDKGYNGLVSTIKYLDEADLSHTGTYVSEEDSQKVLIKNVKGIKVAFLSFTYGTNGIPIPKGKEYCINLNDNKTIKKQLKLAKEQEPDIICVSMHWGNEYQTKQNSTQKNLANFLFENGADIILGNHSHVPQPMEKRTIKLEDGTEKEAFVIYSLGNFLANQNYRYTQDSAILNLEITKNGETGKISIEKVTYTPVYIYKDSRKSKQRFKILDIEKTIEAYESKYDTSIGKTMYNTLKTKLKNIKNIIGKEIK